MQRDFKVNNYTVAQFPNAPLAIALIAVVAGRLLNEGSTAYCLSRAVFYVGLTIWAYLELVQGVNGFRRFLGAAGLAYVIYSVTRDLN